LSSDDYGWFSDNSGWGQSLVAWVKYYNINIPDTEIPALTQDVDFLGKAHEAKLLAKELHAQIKVAGMNDHSPNTAVLSFHSANTDKILIVSFIATQHKLGMRERQDGI